MSGRIAWSSDRDGNQEIYVMDLSDSTITRLTDDPAPDYYPTWSPDGTMIAFARKSLPKRIIQRRLSTLRSDEVVRIAGILDDALGSAERTANRLLLERATSLSEPTWEPGRVEGERHVVVGNPWVLEQYVQRVSNAPF